jgi:hypothetical protein
MSNSVAMGLETSVHASPLCESFSVGSVDMGSVDRRK